MSHIAVYKTTLGKVNIDIIKKALKVLALEETNLEIRDYIEDWYGKKHTSWEGNKIIGAVFGNNLLKGVGISADKDGNLIFVSHDRGPALEKVKSKFEQTYKVIALITALQDMGYEISIISEEGNVKIYEGVSGRHKITFTIDDKGIIATDFDGFAGKICFEEAKRLASELKELGVNVDVQNLERKEELIRDIKEMGMDPNMTYKDYCG